MRSGPPDPPETRASSIHTYGRALSSVSIKTFTRTNLTVIDKNLGRDYCFTAEDPAALCVANALVAARHQRTDHERVWMTLGRLFIPIVSRLKTSSDPSGTVARPGILEGSTDAFPKTTVKWGVHPLAKLTVTEMYVNFSPPSAACISFCNRYDAFAKLRDLQMLAMLSVIVLEIDRLNSVPRESSFSVIKVCCIANQPQ